MTDPNEWVTIYHKTLTDPEGNPLSGRVQRKSYKHVWKDKDWRLTPPKKTDDREE